MKSIDPQLNRLLRAASQAPEPACFTPTNGWVRSVMHSCQTQGKKLDEQLSDAVLKWSLMGALTITALSFAWHFSSAGSLLPEVVSLANSGIEISLAP
jgi:hypothetical protein